MPVLPSLLLDRDGTLIKDKHYLADPSKVELLPGVAKTLQSLARKGVRFFLVSNQSGIGRGIFPKEAAIAVNERLGLLLAPYGVVFTDMLFCPHAPEDGCDCRKPATGMWLTLQERYGLQAAECLMVGDKSEDMRFAANAGLALRALVLTGKGTDTAKGLGIDLPGKRYLGYYGEPDSPACPHLVLAHFSQLERGLELFFMRRDRQCSE